MEFLMDYGKDRSPLPTLEQESAEFLKKIEKMETAVEIARAVVAILPKPRESGVPELMSATQKEMLFDMISAGNKAGIKRFTRSVYFEAFASELGSREAAQKFMMSPEEAEEQGRFD